MFWYAFVLLLLLLLLVDNCCLSLTHLFLTLRASGFLIRLFASTFASTFSLNLWSFIFLCVSSLLLLPLLLNLLSFCTTTFALLVLSKHWIQFPRNNKWLSRVISDLHFLSIFLSSFNSAFKEIQFFSILFPFSKVIFLSFTWS